MNEYNRFLHNSFFDLEISKIRLQNWRLYKCFLNKKNTNNPNDAKEVNSRIIKTGIKFADNPKLWLPVL